MNALPHTTAALLHSARYALPASLLLAAFPLWRGGIGAAAGVLLLVWVTVLQVRMAFDAALLRAWADGGQRAEGFDHAMQTLGIAVKAGRPMEARCRGAVRLFRQWLLASAVQAGWTVCVVVLA